MNLRHVPLMTAMMTLLAAGALTAVPARCEVYSDRIVAVVNGSVILQSDVDKQKNPLIRSFTNLNLGVVPPGKWPTERDFLDELIVIALLEQEASKNGINPDEKSVAASIDMVRKRNNLSQENFVLFLASKGLNYADFRDLFRRKIKLEGLISNEVTRKVPFSEEDAQLYFKKHGAEEIKRQYDELTQTPAQPPPRRFEPEVPTHEEVHEGGKIRLRMLTLKLPGGRNRAAADEAENKAKRIAEELMTGVEFGTLAKKYSQDPLQNKGGDLGFMDFKDMRPEWQKMVRRMKKGQVLGPIKSKEAILMFYLDDEKGRKTKKVPIPEAVRKRFLEQQKKLYEEQMEARRKREEPPQPEKDTKSGTDGGSSDQPKGPEGKEKDASGILSPEDTKEYKNIRNKALLIVRTEKIQARMKELIEELRKKSIIDVKL
ncbi:MAG: peptidylprolyl isomerase [Pseudomonadota bacterium]